MLWSFGSASALARDPYRDDAYAGSPPPAWSPEPAPVAAPVGIYLVTETYAGDSVVRSGALTTYSTETVHEVTGSYARVLESVVTGGRSAYDGAAFNGRAALTDGRGVAGTYYENYVWTDLGFVPVSVVFFQDDSELARSTPVAAGPGPTAGPATVSGVTLLLPPTGSSGGTGSHVIDPGGLPQDGAGRAPALPANPLARVAALLPDRSIEVLRGRRTTIAFVGADVLAWRFVAGEAVALGALTGGPGDAFVARWDRLADPNTAWVLHFVVDYADGTSHERVVRVAVRAPGLVE
jgi:hypothetical protein